MAIITGLKIDGVDMPAPLPYEVETAAMDGKAGRTVDGKMRRDFVADKRTVSLVWGILTQAEASKILKAVSPSKGHIFFEAVVLTAEDGEYTGTFYAGARKETMSVRTATGPIYKGLTINIIER